MTKRKYTFSKNEHLKSRKEISRMFKDGIFLYSEYFSFIYYPAQQNTNHKFAVSVPKKLFKSAVIRNKLKRRIRESFRLNKYLLHENNERPEVFYNILVIYKHNKILPFQEIETEIISFTEKLITSN